ncbi:hypothetical protein [Candidatus Enterococcus ferrettii]|uniref:Uncharacterized protein n=1 Tax=Candidatus Enterococcus ferrettii TaxID=2815324 RepID=A0ABV0EQ11_9ENTE|nr:hypothetical protein [Enterococcus sp. 665A]MBO1341715.1 hypothetical protein [Enterococcus sp. 665A]
MKKRIDQSVFSNMRIKKMIGIILILVVIGIGSVLGINSFKDKKEEVSAHPTNTIKLDEGGTNEFEVPIDGKKNLEFPSGSLYDDHFQANQSVSALSKQISTNKSAKTTLFSSEIRKYIPKSYITDYNNIISMQIFSTHPYKDEERNYPALNQTKIILQSEDGTILDSKWVRNTPEDISQPSAKKATVYNSFFKKSGTEFLALYVGEKLSTTTFIDNGNSLGISIADDNQEVKIGAINLDNQSIQPHWVNSSGNNMSSTVIYKNATQKNYYHVLEHTGGNVLNQYRYETAAGLEGDMTLQGNHHSLITDVFVVDANTIIGSENIVTSKGTFNCLSRWDINHSTKNAVRTELIRENGSGISIEHGISNSNAVYAQIYIRESGEETRVELVKLTPQSGQISIEKTFPKTTRIKFNRDSSGYFFAGQINEFSGPFSGMGTQAGIYSGYMDANFDWRSASSIRLNFTNNNVSPVSIATFTGKGDRFILSGTFQTEETHFIDEVIYGNYPGEISTGTGKKWSSQNRTPTKGNGFVSILTNNEDWSPVIKPPESFEVDISDSGIASGNQAATDRWLLTGSKNGLMTDAKAVKVYDTFDIDQGLNTYNISWLRERVNKNPKSIVYDVTGRIMQSSDPIDWEKLGFDRTKPGPQTVTYFVTDSQNQTSTASTLVNKKTPQTFEEDDYVFDAQNFHVPLEKIDTIVPDANKFKEFAKTMAWNQKNGTIDEDGTDGSKLSGKVEVDTVQLKTLREATVAKPYPVDVTYKPESGIEIKNRVWVFVTTKNTVPNSETNPKVTPVDTNGVVYYADDYSLPFRLRSGHTAADVLDRSNVRVYDYYDSTHETAAELPVLADKTTNPGKLQVVNLNAIKTANQPSLIDSSPPDGPAMIRYEWDGAVDGNHQSGTAKPTLGGLDVNLTGDILLHVRQVIVGDSNQLVVPKEGYLRMPTNDYDGISGTTTENADQLRQVKISSGKNADNPGFETIAVNAEHMDDPLDELELKLIIPEYYEPVGNYLTLGSVDANGASHAGKTEADKNWASLIFQRDDLYDDEEYFITIYLKPKLNQEGPQPYSWDYKKNDLGKIKTK